MSLDLRRIPRYAETEASKAVHQSKQATAASET